MDKIPPGQLALTLSCPVRVAVSTVYSELTSTSLQTSSWGLYVLESSEIVMSHLRFQWQHKSTPTTTSKNDHISLVRVPRSLRALDVQIRQPQQSKRRVFFLSVLVLHDEFKPSSERHHTSYLLFPLARTTYPRRLSSRFRLRECN